MQNPLRRRVILTYLVLLILATAGLGFFLTSLVRNNYIQNLQTNLTSEARILANQTAPYLEQGGPYSELNALIHTNAGQIDQRLTVILPDGQVIAESSQDPSALENHSDRPEIKQALNGEVGSQIRYSDTMATDMLYVASPITVDGEIAGVMRVSTSLQEINDHLALIMRSIYLASLLTLLAALFVSLFLTSFAVQPVRKLLDNITVQSDVIPPSSASHDDEVGQLDRAFHLLTSQLNTQIEELKAERAKLSAVLTHMTDGVLIADADGIVQLINPAASKIFDVSEEDALDHSLIEVVRHHQLVELWRKCQMTGAQQTTTLETASDRSFVQGIATPLEKNMAGSTLLVFQNLTRLRRLEMVRRDFVSNVSHELRTPLAALKAITETLLEGALEDPPAARRFLVRMENEIDNLTQMVQELLELSRIESRQAPLQKQLLSPCELVKTACERMELQASRAGLKLTWDCSPDTQMVNVDKERLGQVFINLLHNAIKFTPPGGQIHVSAISDQGRVTFAVQDSGVGISSEALPRIFERFYKADRARSGGGTGLGLSISRHLVEAHGGRIWADSTPGEGSTFYFSIPEFAEQA
ncbi:MAG: ATP-binding protein [Anaerolineaceae bacterium]|nr:ATP-binding protein [Anaerolineaceae bacterium]